MDDIVEVQIVSSLYDAVEIVKNAKSGLQFRLWHNLNRHVVREELEEFTRRKVRIDWTPIITDGSERFLHPIEVLE